MMGRFGYELDLATLTDEEKETVREQIKTYKKWGQIIHKSDMYRLKSPFASNHFAVEFVSDDKKYIIVIYANKMAEANGRRDRLKLTGLEKGAKYRILDSAKVYGQDVLEGIGIQMNYISDFESKMMIFERI